MPVGYDANIQVAEGPGPSRFRATVAGDEKPTIYTIAPNADGTGTATIPDTVFDYHAVITSANANHWVTLPTPEIGRKVTLYISGATGYEIRSNAPATVGISGGTGANAESAIAATAVIVQLECVSATNWVGISQVAASTVTAVEAAA